MIRDLTPADLPSIEELLVEATAEEAVFKARIGCPQTLPAVLVRNVLLEANWCDTAALGLFKDDYPVGIAATLRDVWPCEEDGSFVIFVSASQRRCGCGSELLSAIGDRAVRLGITEIFTSLHPDHTSGFRFLISHAFDFREDIVERIRREPGLGLVPMTKRLRA